MYADGYAGCEYRPEKITAAVGRFDDAINTAGGFAIGSDAAYAGGIVGTGAGRLSLIFPCVEKLYPGALPGPAQQRGDCTAHAQKNADLASMCAEVVAGKPDDVTGLIEGAPDVPPAGVANGVLSSEWPYWWRGYAGDGWQCHLAAQASVTHGCMLRKRYSDDLDLTQYSGKLAGRYGRKPPPDAFDAIGRQHIVRTATRVAGVDQLADFIHNGYAVTSCGSEGFSSVRDQHGMSRKRGSWSHAMAYLGIDCRPETVKHYGDELVLLCNSWGNWNTGGRRIMGTEIDIPHGCFWARYSDIKRRSCIAMSSVDGWPPKELPDVFEGW